MPVSPFDNSIVYAAKDFFELVKLAQIYELDEDIFVIYKYGQNSDVDTGSAEDIWRVGGQITYPTTTETLDLVSSSASDTSAGTGARTVLVEGLDANYDRISETLSLNGTSAVTTVLSYFRLNEATVKTVGTEERNVGAITVTNTTSALTLGQIIAGACITQNTHFTIPASFTGFLMTEDVSVDGPLCEIFPRKSKPGSVGINPTRSALANGRVYIRNEIPLEIEEQIDYRYRGRATVNNTNVMVTYTLLCVHNRHIRN